jgi:glycerophosphoryl diester phosphodiesterase
MYSPYHLFRYNYTRDDDFTVIAHRGASAYYPENTLAAFEGAIAMGADMVELDIQLTADGEVVAFHDEKMGRCTDSSGKVAECTLDTLKMLDAGSWFDRKFQGIRIPTLMEVLKFCKDKIAVNIEIKTEAVTDGISGGIEEKCLKIVQQAGMSGHTVYSSFDPRALLHLKKIDGSAPIGILFKKKYYGSRLPSDIIAALGADAFNCAERELNQKWLADLKLHKIPVNIYTVNDEKNMRRLLTMGVGGIFTNCPDVLKKVWMDFRNVQKREMLTDEYIQSHD